MGKIIDRVREREAKRKTTIYVTDESVQAWREEHIRWAGARQFVLACGAEARMLGTVQPTRKPWWAVWMGS